MVTGTRAEYGLLYWLMKNIEDAKDLELQIIATGMHLSPEFDITYLQIEKDGFTIILTSSGDKKINVIKEVRAVTALGLKEAKDLVEGAPKEVKSGVNKKEAEEIKTKLEAAGAKVELK